MAIKEWRSWLCHVQYSIRYVEYPTILDLVFVTGLVWLGVSGDTISRVIVAVLYSSAFTYSSGTKM